MNAQVEDLVRFFFSRRIFYTTRYDFSVQLASAFPPADVEDSVEAAEPLSPASLSVASSSSAASSSSIGIARLSRLAFAAWVTQHAALSDVFDRAFRATAALVGVANTKPARQATCSFPIPAASRRD